MAKKLCLKYKMTGKQLKNSILQLAIQGKLVPQDANDEPASVLLQRIRKEKEQLLKQGKLKKKDLVTTPISDEEKPFEIPESWEWCRIGELFKTTSGSTPLSSNPLYYNGEINWTRTTDLNNGYLYSCERKVTQKAMEECKLSIIPQNSVCLAMYGGAGTIGKYSLIKFDTTINQSVCAIHPNGYCSMEYLLCFMQYHRPNWMDFAAGSRKDPNINKIIINNCLFPLPPLSEQHRIVAKIEELMPLVEEYDKAQTKLDELNGKLPEALKKSILQEAIMGKLVPQDPNEEPASKLLERIRKEKEALVKEGKLKKKDLVTTPITDEEKPFEIPESWEWCRLGDLGLFERGNGIKRDETRTEGYPCVRYGEMYTAYRKNPTFDKTISFTTKEVFEKCRKAHKGDIFMALTGENKKDIALAAQYVGDNEIAVGGDLCHFTILGAFALYFVYLINSPYYSSQKELLATGDIIVHISADKLGFIPIPLPPLSEQKRIVEKIEQLFVALDAMKM